LVRPSLVLEIVQAAGLVGLYKLAPYLVAHICNGLTTLLNQGGKQPLVDFQREAEYDKAS